MPVGTLGTVKGVEIEQLRQTGAEMILGNTYHLSLRPGEEVVRDLGGLHQFTGWTGPILTDSGGFQVFSLGRHYANGTPNNNVRVNEDGVVFRSHIDGRKLFLSPEKSLEIQHMLGSDIAMVLDHVVALPNSRDMIEEAMLRSVRWAIRSLEAARRQCLTESPSNAAQSQKVFAIVQGGLDANLRRQCAEALTEWDFPGYAIGGLSVGETPQEMYDCIDQTVPFLPQNKPRYLMGVGTPQDIVNAIARGIDMFDCVMPTRNGRNAQAFTDFGTLRLRNAKYQRDEKPLDETCPCPACKRSRGYIRHLFMAGEMLGPILLTIHNLTYYQRLVARARQAIETGRFAEFKSEFEQTYTASG